MFALVFSTEAALFFTLFGIVFEFEDGTNSPVYHIPGRKSTSADTQLQIGSNKDLIQNDPCVTENFPKWKVYDTATITSTFSEYTDLEDGKIGDDDLTSQGTYIYNESVSETIEIDGRNNYNLKVLQDDSTLINSTDGKIIDFDFPNYSEPSNIRFTKKTSSPRNTVVS